MAAPSIRFAGQTPRPIAGVALSSPPMKAACQLKQNRVKQMQQGISSIIKGISKNKSFSHCLAVQTGSNSNFSPSETIEQFYTCINNNNLEQLAKLLSDDCRYNDLSFPQPFQGKEVISFSLLLNIFMINIFPFCS